jgi:tetratricopeptide (TPR) repeat protein
MASTARIDELKKKFDENPRRYFAPLANEFRKAGEVEQAIMICEEFLPQQPGHMSGHIVYGQALFEAGRMEASRTVFETALTLDPENLIALRHLGDIAKGQGDLEAARRWYDRVLEADPRNDEIQGLIASLDGGSAGAAAPAPAAAPSPFAPPASVAESPVASPQAPPPIPEPIDFELSVDVVESMPSAPERPEPSEPPAAGRRAEGLESIEFTPPSGPVDRAHDLGSSLEAGEFTAPADAIAPLAGLEENAMGAFERNVPEGGPPLPMLDTWAADAPPPTPPAEEQPAVGPSTLEFAVPSAAARPPASGRSESPTMPELEPEGDSLPDASANIPRELPPAVIAAESELLDFEPLPTAAPEAVPPSAPATARADVPVDEPPSAPPEPALEIPSRRAAPAPTAPFVTETMAELFLKQGFRDQALDVYRQLLAASPSDARLQQRVAELQPAGPAPAGDSVRDFLSRLATLRPGERAAAAAPPADDDFAIPAAPPAASVSPPPAPAPAAAPAGAPHMSTGVERGATTQGASGSIDALFGNRAVGTSEDSAASALAQAFGGAPPEPTPALTGRPARAANGELSLDSVFRDSPPRPPRASQSFSFDQFFSPEGGSPERASPAPPAPAAEPGASEPAERSADDIEQFNSWLQGLKPK